ncbi:hypothetical protein PENTCL1PPCAC_16949 [Pristionchus entomophagus]|uniref:G protein-coupled receptor n=1 Tax=Pristionchus entomophagus TaxID=358040 RepID=A0AAV5TKD1_9BILA|nr:hypothetical protein PENTCL1PPCAC_16949 [Pristionchus entomophagus]
MQLSSEDLSYGDSLHFLFLSLIDISAIAINLILIAAIILSTPPILKNYSVLLLLIAILDCNAALMSLLSTVIIENMDGAVVYVYVGPCRLIHAELCYAALAIHVELIGESCVLLLISFSFRLWSFSSTLSTGTRTDNRAKLFFICFIATIPAVIAMVTRTSPSPPPQHLLEHPDLKGRLFSVFNMTATHILSKENILPRVSIGYVMFVYLTASPILFVLRRRLLRKIQSLITS